MIETFLGTMLLCCGMVIIVLLFIQFVARKINMKVSEESVGYFGDYIISFVIFFVASAICLLFYVIFYFEATPDTAIYNSGLLFMILGLAINLILKKIYQAIMKIVNLISKSSQIYLLKTVEKNWIMIFISFGYAAYFWLFQEKTYSFSYLTLALGYCLGMFTSKESFEEILSELKSLTKFYWFASLMILMCGFSAIRYTNAPLNIASIVGIVLGYAIGIMLMCKIEERWYKQSSISVD